jgi:hypothetical protein
MIFLRSYIKICVHVTFFIKICVHVTFFIKICVHVTIFIKICVHVTIFIKICVHVTFCINKVNVIEKHRTKKTKQTCHVTCNDMYLSRNM